jgi:large subunit ribosomal protein L24
MTINLKKNDNVQILSGKEKDKIGKILRVDHKKNRVVVEKLNMIKRHVKPRSPQEPGGIIDKEAPLHLSNVGLYCNKCKKAVRYSIKINNDNKKVRICKKCGSEI